MPLQATSGAASYDAFGGGAAAKVNYIEDFFQSYLRTGTGASATVTTGLDGSTKETLVWTKSRSAATNHKLTDNVRGATKALSSNTTGAEATDSQGLTAFSATGYTIGTNTDYNNSGATYVDWQWVAQPKFFDVLTYTGNGTAGRTVAHNLGSIPACIIVKAYSVDTGDFWGVYHRSLGATKAIFLSATNAAATSSIYWNDTEPTSTNFTVGDWSGVNQNGTSYVAYIFAHDAGGFGLTGTDNVISCGSFTTDGSGNATVNLGYEPQWLLIKTTSSAANWLLYDNMRGIATDGNSALLRPNLSDEEVTQTGKSFNATGFAYNGGTSTDHIYIAIRRGPMKVPTVGTSVFTPVARAGTSAIASVNTGIVTDAVWETGRSGQTNFAYDRLRGPNTEMSFTSTNAESSYTASATLTGFDSMTGFTVGADASSYINGSGINYINWAFKRAPSFFDEVCYTGTGSANRQISHNLGVAPELVICKARNNGSQEWRVLSTALSQVGKLNGAGAFSTTNLAIYFGNDSTYVAPTSSVFTVGSAGDTNANTVTYVAYLFATCAGVSKVGSYTGNGTTQTIDCGFTGGARFVLIKRTDSTGDWYTYDTARGMTVLTDPYLLLNTTAAETATLGSVTTVSTGFALNSSILAAINVSGGTYIFFAVA